jgi:hypothetical protein
MDVLAIIASCQTAPTEACSANAIMPISRVEIAHMSAETSTGAA